MKITVFGGSGFLGSHVCDKLSEANHEVTIFDRVNSPWLKEDQSMVIGDITDEEDVANAVSGSDMVFNFAGIADIGEANKRAVDTVRYNVLGNAIILEQCVKSEIERYVFASSMYVYSSSGGFYRCSKQSCELYIETFAENFGLDYTILRFGTLYGTRSNQFNAIHRYIHQALHENKITYVGGGNAIREYISVEDAARCCVEILKPEYIGEHIILTGPQQMKVKDLLRMIGEILGKKLEFDFRDPVEQAHYEITPYSFNPKIGKKLILPLQMDLGQGLLKVIEEIHQQLSSTD